jgi:hypothetical protein
LSCIRRCVFGRVLSEPDSDELIRAAAFLVGDVMEDLVVSVAGITAEDSPRPEMPGEHRVQFSAIQADLGQEEQKSNKSDDDPELAVRR